MILSAQTIRELCQLNAPMVNPFCERTKENGVSYGLSPAGYDVRIEFDKEGIISEYELKPGEFILASTIEKFCMPHTVVGVVHDKSSWARRGVAVQNTVIEPGWFGWLTLELTNHGSESIVLKRGMGIAQILFHRLDKQTRQPYEGKYQSQKRGPISSRQ